MTTTVTIEITSTKPWQTPVLPKPDQAYLDKHNVDLTGEYRAPLKDELFVSLGDSMNDGRRWILKKRVIQPIISINPGDVYQDSMFNLVVIKSPSHILNQYTEYGYNLLVLNGNFPAASTGCNFQVYTSNPAWMSMTELVDEVKQMKLIGTASINVK